MASGRSALPERRGIMYTFHSRVRYSEIDADGHITLDNIINYMQDCSTFHSEDLGIGIQYLKKNHQVWMLSAWQIVIEQLPKFAQEITIGTQAYDFSNVFGYRNFAIMDETGAYLVKANSIWCLTDTVTGRPMRIKPEFVANPSKLRDSSFCKPCAPPISMINIKIPQKTPNAVSKLRALLRVMVKKISSHVSKSNSFIISWLLVLQWV